MIRVNRPFDRWFDLSDPYDDAAPARRQGDTPSPDAHREWTYEAPRPPVPKRQERDQGKGAW
jgi:hypothetical protein